MKLPSSDNCQFSQNMKKQRRMSDVVSSRKSLPPVDASSYISRLQRKASSVATKSYGLDGIRAEKHPFLKQLKTRSARESFWLFLRKTELYFRFAKLTIARFTPSIAPHKMLYGSLIGGVAFGIVSMGFIEHFFGPGVFARATENQMVATVMETADITTNRDASAPDTSISKEDENTGSGSDIFFEYFNEAADEKYQENIRQMVKGYPIEAMLPYIFEQDRMTSSFLIGIAKKESNWGKRVPVLDDQDCFNYWGYRGVRRLMGTGGHTCFNSRQDAVATVARRINTLTHSEALNTPEKMIIWKCGFSCSGHSRESVKKWIADVDMYFSMAGGDEEELPVK